MFPPDPDRIVAGQEPVHNPGRNQSVVGPQLEPNPIRLVHLIGIGSIINKPERYPIQPDRITL